MAGRQSQSSFDYGYNEEPERRSSRDSRSVGQRYINVEDIDTEVAGRPEERPEDVELTTGTITETDPEHTDDQSGTEDKMKGLFGKKDKKGKKNKEKKSKEKKEKKPKQEKKSGSKGIGGLFAKFRKNKEPNKDSHMVDIPPDINTTENTDDTPPKPPLDDTTVDSTDSRPAHLQQVDMHPGGYSVNPSDTIQRGPSKMDSFKKSFTSIMRPPPKFPAVSEEENKVELHPQKAQSHIRCSTFLNVLLVFLFILGIVLTALGTVDDTLYVIGPIMLGLSLFALIGKVFFTLSWQEDPLPRVSPVVKVLEDSMYKRSGYRAQQQQQYMQYGYWQQGTNAIAMQQFNYPAPSMDYQGYPPGVMYTDGPVGELPPYDPTVDDTVVPPSDLEAAQYRYDGDHNGYQLPDEFQQSKEDYDPETEERLRSMSEGFPSEMAPSRPSRVSFQPDSAITQEGPVSLDIGPDLSMGSFPGDPQAHGSFQEGELDQPIAPPSMEMSVQDEPEGGPAPGSQAEGTTKKPSGGGRDKKNCVIQ